MCMLGYRVQSFSHGVGNAYHVIIVNFNVRIHVGTLDENGSQLEKTHGDISPRSD